MSLSWYAMHSKPNKEAFLEGQIKSHGMEVYYPVLYVNPVNPRSRKIRPYFPNYLFIHVDLDVINISDLRWMPGASGLVSFGGEPAPVPDLLIANIRKQVAHYNETVRDLEKNFKKGDVVLIQEGPFAGYEAIFDTHISGRDRVRVLLGLLKSRHMPVEIASRQIRRVKRSR